MEQVPVAWMERLFSRLTASYGNKMAAMWGDCPQADVMDAWRAGLAGVNADQIKVALVEMLKAYPDWPPTLGQFLALCKPAPVAAMHRPLLALPRPAYREIPPHIRAEIDKLMDPHRKRDPKDWARRILKEHEAGTYKLLIGVEMAREALGEVTA